MSKKRREEHLLGFGELARAAGVSTQTLQYYLMIALIEESGRTEGGRRLFDPRTVRLVKLIRKLNKRYPLRDIRETFLKRHPEGKGAV